MYARPVRRATRKREVILIAAVVGTAAAASAVIVPAAMEVAVIIPAVRTVVSAVTIRVAAAVKYAVTTPAVPMPAVTTNVITPKLNSVVVMMLFLTFSIYAALVKPAVEVYAVLRAKPVVIPVTQVGHVMIHPIKDVVPDPQEAMIIYVILMKYAVMTVHVPPRAKNGLLVNRPAVRKMIYIAEHVLVSLMIVPITLQSIIQMNQYTIATKDVQMIVPTMHIHPHLVMMCIPAATIYIIDLQSVRQVMNQEIYHFLQGLWIVGAEITPGDALVANEAAIAALGMSIVRDVSNKVTITHKRCVIFNHIITDQRKEIVMNTVNFTSKLNRTLIVFLVSAIYTPRCTSGNNSQCNWIAVNHDRFSEILTMIDRRVVENHDRIKTWQGKVNMDFDSTYVGEEVKKLYEEMLGEKPLPNKITDHVELKREFAVDVNKGLLYENVYPDVRQYIIDDQTKQKIQLNERMRIGSGTKILTPTYHISCREVKNRDGVIVSRRAIKRNRPAGKLTCQSNLLPVFDPRDTVRIFGDINEETFAPLGETFAKYLKFFNEHPFLDGHPTITVEESVFEDTKEYRITLITLAEKDNGIAHLFDKLVCSSEVGYNVVSYSLTDADGRIINKKTFEYDLFNGVYLPTQKVELSYDYPTGNLKKQNTITFFNEKVNEPISENVFTYENLGLQEGDKFIDKIENKEYLYRETTKTLELFKKE